MNRSTLLIIAAMTISIAILATLGTWQVARLKWKEDLVARINARVAGEHMSLQQVELLWSQRRDVDYMPVKLNGIFDHQRELYYFNTWNGKAGWDVITPLMLSDNRVVLLNRGFVPTTFRDKNNRQSGLIDGVVEIAGLARNPVLEKPNSLIPDNQLVQREFFWKSYSQMAKLAGMGDINQVLPFMIDQGKTNIEGGYPVGGTTRINFSNNHLQYAVTWYGLGLALFTIGSAFLYSRRIQSA
ncbi:MAG: SURF1 family protein [Hyphomicrobiales bacterium]|nr:SURF1 family protein [Hyphomicrobiales bacterium]